MITFNSFAPDLDDYIPEIIVDCDNITPVSNGFRSSPSLVTGGYPALPAKCRGAAVTLKLDGSYRTFAGTETALYEGANGVWDDVTRTVGGAYNLGAEGSWKFAQFGDVTIAANKGDVLQEINAGTDFTDISGSPKASLIETVSGFVMIADTNEGTYGDQSDRWWCSALYDYTDWTPSVSTQCTSGRLVDAPGGIRGLKRLGNNIVAYKEKAIFLGRYVGAPLVWSWQQIPGDIGVLSNETIVSIGTAHLFVGYDDIYYFDGTRPVSVGNNIKDWFFADLDKSFRYKIVGTHDRLTSNVYWFYPSKSSNGELDSCIIYNYKYQKWGKASYSIEVATEVLTGQITYDSLGDNFSTYDDIPAIAYDSPFWQTSAPVLSVFDTTHTLKTLSGSGTSMSITTAILGEDQNFSLISRVIPRFNQKPTSGTMTNFYSNESGSTMTQDAVTTMTEGRFDLLRSARWHQFKFTFLGDVIINGFTAKSIANGEE